MNIFPFTLGAVEGHHYAMSDPLARDLWMRDRLKLAPNLIWYAASLEVLSPTCVIVHVYDMADAFHGGIGEVVYRYEPLLGPEALKRVAAYVKDRQLEKAEAELVRRECEKRRLMIENIRVELFGGDQ